MAEYLAELYVARGDHRVAQQHADRVRRASAELILRGRHVRCLRSIFVPEDETCFLLFEATSADSVAAALYRAGLPYEHISAAMCSTGLPDLATAPAVVQDPIRTTR